MIFSALTAIADCLLSDNCRPLLPPTVLKGEKKIGFIKNGLD